MGGGAETMSSGDKSESVTGDNLGGDNLTHDSDNPGQKNLFVDS